MDVKDFFDIRSLTEEKLGHIQFVLNSPSYVEVFEPYLRSMRNSMNTKLLDPSRERKDQYPDGFLRGGCNVIDGLLALFKKFIEETDIEQIHKSVSGITQEQAYQRLREEGKVKPASGIGHIVEEQGVEGEDYDPAEDY